MIGLSQGTSKTKSSRTHKDLSIMVNYASILSRIREEQIGYATSFQDMSGLTKLLETEIQKHLSNHTRTNDMST